MGSDGKCCILLEALSSGMRRLVEVGERFEKRVRLDPESVSAFATAAQDLSPLHHDADFAARSRFKQLIASGTQTISLLYGLAATHFCDRGVMLGLEFSQRYLKAVGANEEILLRWEVTGVMEKSSLAGWLVRLHGEIVNEQGELALSSDGLVLITANI